MKTGGVFQFAVCRVPWEWWRAKNCLSDCFRSVGSRNIILIGTRARYSKDIFHLCMPATVAEQDAPEARMGRALGQSNWGGASYSIGGWKTWPICLWQGE